MRRSPRPGLVLAASLLLAAGALAGCSKDQGSKAAFCAQVKQVPALETVLSRFSEADADVLADKIDKARDAYDQLADAAPPAIDEQTDEVVSLVDDILQAVEDHPTDPAAASAQARKAVAEHKGIEADRAKVARYAEDECDVQLDATLSSGAGATSTTTSTTEVGSVITAPSTTTTSTGG